MRRGLCTTPALAAAGADDGCPVSVNLRGHENTEWSRSYAYHLVDGRKNLSRVLLVGDSIVNGYEGEARRLLETNDLFAALDPLERNANWSDTYHHKPHVRKMDGGLVAKAVLSAIGRK